MGPGPFGSTAPNPKTASVEGTCLVSLHCTHVSDIRRTYKIVILRGAWPLIGWAPATRLTYNARNPSQVEQTENGYGGGGIYAKEGVAVSLSGATSVRNNRANQCGGGGIRITHGSTLSLSGATEVIGNSGDSGGGVFAEQKVSIFIAGAVRFDRNIADPYGGGAIYISGCALTIPIIACAQTALRTYNALWL